MSLPVDHLSASSLSTFMRCPEKWRRRYVCREYEPPSGNLILGSAAHAAETQSDADYMESGAPAPVEAVLDHYAAEFDHEVAEAEDVDWGDHKPGALKDAGAGALTVYHRRIVAEMPKPIAIEREARLILDDDLDFLAYMDLETEDGTTVDRKFAGRAWSKGREAHELGATSYLAIRRAEAERDGVEPSGRFAFHIATHGTKNPSAEVRETTRTDAELDHFIARIYDTAEEIEWRLETDNWAFAQPSDPLCGEKYCGYWDDCLGGGKAKRLAAEAVRNA